MQARKVLGDLRHGRGSIGLIALVAATAALDVLERQREIGVLRALGASPRDIVVVLLTEAGAVVVASAALAVALSIAMARAANGAAAEQLLHVAVPLQLSLRGWAELSGGAIFALLVVLGLLMAVLRRPTVDALNAL